MELHGQSLIAAPRQRVWDALNDPDTLARCIDGVESLKRSENNRFEGKMNAKIGPVRATFAGSVSLEDLDPPNGYRLVGEGKGGVAGFAKGAADVRLSDADDGTLLVYDVKSAVGGKLAQLGSRLIEGAAKSYAETFFARLKAELELPAPNPAAGSDTGDAVAAAASVSAPAEGGVPLVERGGRGLSPLAWGALVTAFAVALVVMLLLIR